MHAYFQENLSRVAQMVSQEKYADANKLVEHLCEVQESLGEPKTNVAKLHLVWVLFYSVQCMFKLGDNIKLFDFCKKKNPYLLFAVINNQGYFSSIMMEVCLKTGHVEEIPTWAERALRARKAEGRMEDFRLAVRTSVQIASLAGDEKILQKIFEIWESLGREFGMPDLEEAGRVALSSHRQQAA